MKIARKTIAGLLPALSLCLAVAVRLAAGPDVALAFHNGGTGDCGDCHTTHRAGAIAENAATAQGVYMLKGSDASSTCLNCHQAAGLAGPTGQYVSTPESEMPAGVPPKQMTPGGDFGWLKKNYTWKAPGSGMRASPGYMHGHSIVAVDYGYSADPVITRAPGGAYPASALSCTSCHDPHGTYRRIINGAIASSGAKICNSGSYDTSPDPTADCPVGVYRLLGGIGYQPASLNGYSFTADPPAAVAPSVYNRSEETTETRVAYGSGMSEWCENCHSINPGNGRHSHPAGSPAKLGTLAKYYNMYVKSGDVTGTSASSYSSLVPFEEGTSDYRTLRSHAKNDDSYLRGPDANSNVMCLTCHRAHASGWDFGLRFNTYDQDFITTEAQTGAPLWPGTDTTRNAQWSMGRTSEETRRAYYNIPARRLSPYQRTLCNKCHIRD
ncbi:MAG: hypothetical protein M0Z48_04005 [Nitrospiraceae bacterium]|nr:hypothetical protein [Nitrospiraceae bacterium]